MSAPSITSLSPASVTAGSSAFTLTVNGQNFVSGAQVNFGASAPVTTFVNSNTLTAAITAPMVLNKGIIPVTVLQSGVLSTVFLFAIPAAPAAFDLTTLAEVKGYLYPAIGNVTDDFILQDLITQGSQFLINEVRRGADLYSSTTYSERYDGNGQDFLRLRHNPVTAVSQVKVGNTVIPQSPDYVLPGWAINQNNFDGTGTGLIMVPGNYNYPQPFSTYSVFCKGRMNVLVNYTAGYSMVPADLVEATVELVGQNYKRRGWIDEKSQAMPMGAGTKTFRDWSFTPKISRVIQYYRRVTP